MKSFEQRFYIENPTLAEEMRRNCRLLLALLGAAFAWLVKGTALRYRLRKLQNGEKIHLEDWA